MKIDLSDYKKKRPNIVALLDYIERAIENEMAHNEYSAALPYPENLDRFTRLFLPILSYHPETEMFRKSLNYFADWVEKYHFELPNLVLVKFMLSNMPDIFDHVARAIGLDTFEDGELNDMLTTFFQSRTIEAVHLAYKGPTVAYHPDLFRMLMLTDASKLSNVPITLLRQPYPSMFLDWKDCPDKVLDKRGVEYQGCYVQSRVVSWDKATELNLIQGDKSLRTSMDKGTIVEGEDILFFDMLFIGESGNPDYIENNLFSIASSLKDSISIKDSVFTEDEINALSFDGIPLSSMDVPVGTVINSILYMLSKQSLREEVKELAGMQQRIFNIKNSAKKRKAQSRLIKNTYDYVRIGRSYELKGVAEKESGQNSGSKNKKPHIRYGFYNTFYTGDRVLKDSSGKTIKNDEGESIPIPKEEQTKEVVWVMPVLVNANSLSEIDVKDRKLM